jgi:hypothetical protein
MLLSNEPCDCARLEGSSSHQEGVELAKQRAEIERRIVGDPVILALRSGYEAIQAHGNAAAQLAHGELWTKKAAA